MDTSQITTHLMLKTESFLTNINNKTKITVPMFNLILEILDRQEKALGK